MIDGENAEFKLQIGQYMDRQNVLEEQLDALEKQANEY